MAEALTIDLKKLRALIVERTGPDKGMSRRALSLAATSGKNPDLIRDIMRVDKRRPTLEAVSGICAALDVDLSQFVNASVTSPKAQSDWVRVEGAVEAGVWREKAEWSYSDKYEIEVGPSDEQGERFALVVEGRSMDRIMPPGTHLECVRLVGSGYTPEVGDYVIAERKRGDLYERTVKLLARTPTGDYELRAESYLPEFDTPIPIGRPDSEAFGDDETRVIAWVLQAHAFLHKRKRRMVQSTNG